MPVADEDGRGTGPDRAAGFAMGVSMARTRVKFAAFASLAALSALSGGPVELTLLLAGTGAAIPAAVAAAGGRRMVRVLLLLPARPAGPRPPR